LHAEILRHFRPAPVIAIGINSIGLSDMQLAEAVRRIEAETGLPAADVLRDGPAKIADAVMTQQR